MRARSGDRLNHAGRAVWFRTLGVLVLMLTLGGSGSDSNAVICDYEPVDPGQGCLADVPCQTSNTCESLPTSLRAVGDPYPGDGWYGGRTGCGTERCWRHLRCCCGGPLGTSVCIGQ